MERQGRLCTHHGRLLLAVLDATYLKAHRTATSLAAKKGGVVA
jgi:hypothetical protein